MACTHGLYNQLLQFVAQYVMMPTHLWPLIADNPCSLFKRPPPTMGTCAENTRNCQECAKRPIVMQLRGFGFFEEQPARVRYRFLKSPNGFMEQFDKQLLLEDVSTGSILSVKTEMTAKRPPFHTQTDAMRAFHLEANVHVADVFRLWLNDSGWHQACHLPAFQACIPRDRSCQDPACGSGLGRY